MLCDCQVWRHVTVKFLSVKQKTKQEMFLEFSVENAIFKIDVSTSQFILIFFFLACRF